MTFQTKIKLKYTVQLRKERVEGLEDSKPFIGLEHIEPGTGRLLVSTLENGELPTEMSLGGESLCNLFEPEDVLFGKLRPYLAKTWVASFSGRCTTEFLVVTPEKVDAQYLKYNFLAREFLEAVSAAAYGAKMPRVDWDFIGNQKIFFLPQSTQRLIANYLNRETAHIDTLIAAKECMLTLLAEKRRALIASAVTRGLDVGVEMKDSGVAWLGELPKHWELTKLKYLVSITGGGTPSKSNEEYWNGHIPWVSPKDMKSYFITETEDSISDKALSGSATNLIPSNSLLLVVRSGILKHTIPVGINLMPVSLNQDMKALVPLDNKTLSQYLSLIIMGCQNQLLAEWVKQGTTVESIEMEYLYNTIFPIPPIAEQQTIIAYIHKETTQIDVLRIATERTISLLKERRSALIAAAVTGQIKIPES